MPNEILTGSRYPASSATPNVAQDIQNAVQDLADNTVPAFATVAARDTAYNSWVSAGNAMRDGLMCAVAGVPQVYRSGSWHGLAPIVYTGAAYTGNSTTLSFATFSTVNVPDPGYAYRLEVDATMQALVSTGSTWNFTARVDNQAGELIRPVGVVTSTSYVPLVIVGGVSATTYTGAHAVVFNCEKISGLAGDGYQPNPTTNVQSYRVRVIPA